MARYAQSTCHCLLFLVILPLENLTVVSQEPGFLRTRMLQYVDNNFYSQFDFTTNVTATLIARVASLSGLKILSFLHTARFYERLVEAMADKPGRLVAVLAPWDSGYGVGAGTDIHDPGDY